MGRASVSRVRCLNPSFPPLSVYTSPNTVSVSWFTPPKFFPEPDSEKLRIPLAAVPVSRALPCRSAVPAAASLSAPEQADLRAPVEGSERCFDADGLVTSTERLKNLESLVE